MPIVSIQILLRDLLKSFCWSDQRNFFMCNISYCIHLYYLVWYNGFFLLNSFRTHKFYLFFRYCMATLFFVSIFCIKFFLQNRAFSIAVAPVSHFQFSGKTTASNIANQVCANFLLLGLCGRVLMLMTLDHLLQKHNNSKSKSDRYFNKVRPDHVYRLPFRTK